MATTRYLRPSAHAKGVQILHSWQPSLLIRASVTRSSVKGWAIIRPRGEGAFRM